MPIVAVGVAIGAAVFAGAGVAAAGLTVVTALEVVAAVGATVSAVGAVTGNKALTLVGAGLGAVGGIGAVAAGAGLLGDAAASGASLFGPSAAASTADTGAAAGAGVDATAAATGATSSDVIDSFAGNAGLETLSGANPLTGAADLAGAPSATAAASGAASALTPPPGDGTFVGASTNSSLDTPAATSASTDATGAAGAAPTADATPTTTPTPNLSMPPTSVTPAAGGVSLNGPPVTPGDIGGTDPLTGETITNAVSPTTGQIIGMPDASSGILGNILGVVQKNPLLAFGALQAGGQFLSGLTSTITPAQVGALNAQASANQAAANFTAQQTQNLAQPKPIATLAPVTGTPGNIITPPSAGLINGAPPVNVTGVPA